MARLEHVSIDDLHDALEGASTKKEAVRLMVAILYKQGPSVPMIARWFDLREATVYAWFDRLEADPIAEAVKDRPRPGRPPKLTTSQQEQFHRALAEQPSAYGYEGAEWSSALAKQYLEDEFDVEYTRRHVRRLLREGRAGSMSTNTHRKR